MKIFELILIALFTAVFFIGTVAERDDKGLRGFMAMGLLAGILAFTFIAVYA